MGKKVCRLWERKPRFMCSTSSLSSLRHYNPAVNPQRMTDVITWFY
jgi:hypothetical protein